MTEMVLVRADDWVGVYIYGFLETEAHSLDPVDAVELAISYKVTSIRTVWCDSNWLHGIGNLPHKLKDVKLES